MKVKFWFILDSIINLNFKVMKVKLLYLAFAAVLFTSQLRATTPATILTGGTNVNFSTTDKVFKMSLHNAAAETVTIFLDDTEGVNLLTETVETTPNYIKNYRLENLPAGKYIFTVKRNGHKVVQPIDITPTGISIFADAREETLLPSLLQKGDKVFVKSFVNTGDKTLVRILNNEGALMFEETYKEDMVHKTFDMSKLATGVYFFEVQTKETTEYFTVVK
jgi:hypothetical protein